jgi:hypothetical protein
MDSVYNGIRTVDRKIGKSTFGRIFRLEGCGHVDTELIAILDLRG